MKYVSIGNNISVCCLEFQIKASTFAAFAGINAYIRLKPNPDADANIFYCCFSDVKYPWLDYTGLYEHGVPIP